MVADQEKAKQLNCSNCSIAEQSLRNCSGKGSPAKIYLNDKIHTRCPRAVHLESVKERYWAQTYIECRNNGTYPAAGGAIDQTHFCKELFEFLDDLSAAMKRKQADKHSKAQREQQEAASKKR